MPRLSILNSNSDHSSTGKHSKKKTRELFLRRLERVRSRPENRKCADCNASNPSWASLLAPPSRSQGDQSMGVFCCHKCCNYHFLLGRDVCVVKNLKKVDEWTGEEIRVLEASGNEKSRAIYEGNLNRRRPSPEDQSAQEQFIRDKYKHLEFFCVKAHMKHLSSSFTSPVKTKSTRKPKSITKSARRVSNESSLSAHSSHTCSTFVMDEDFSSSELGWNGNELGLSNHSCSEIALRKVPTEEDYEDQQDDNKYASMNCSEPAHNSRSSPVPPRQARRASLAATNNSSSRNLATSSSLQRACAAGGDPNRSPVPIRSTRRGSMGGSMRSMNGSTRQAPSTRRERRATLAATMAPSTRRSSTLRQGRRSSMSNSLSSSNHSASRRKSMSQSEHGRSTRKSSSSDLSRSVSLDLDHSNSNHNSTRKWNKLSASATTTRTRTLPQATPSSKMRRASIASLYNAGGESKAPKAKPPATNLVSLQQQAEERTARKSSKSSKNESVSSSDEEEPVQEEEPSKTSKRDTSKTSKRDAVKEESSKPKTKKESKKKKEQLDDIPELVELPTDEESCASSKKEEEEHTAQVPSDEDLERMVMAKMGQLTSLMVAITKPKEDKDQAKEDAEEEAAEDDDDASWEFCPKLGHFVNKNKAKTTTAPVVEVSVPDESKTKKKEERRRSESKSRRSSRRSSLDGSSRHRESGSSRRSSLAKELSRSAMSSSPVDIYKSDSKDSSTMKDSSRHGSSRRDLYKSESKDSTMRDSSRHGSSRRDLYKSESKDSMKDSSRRRSSRRASVSTSIPSSSSKDSMDCSKRSRRSSTSSSRRPSSLQVSLNAARTNE